MRKVGIWSVHHEKVWKIGDRDAQIGTRIILAPHIADRFAVAPDDVHRAEHAPRLKPRGQHQHIEFMACAVLHHDCTTFDMVDRIDHQINIGPGQHAVPVVVPQHALAIGRIVRGRLADQFGIVADFGGNVCLKLLANLGVLRVERMGLIWPVGVHLQHRMEPVRRRPEQLKPEPFGVERDILEHPLLVVGDRFEIERVGHRPMRRTLQDGKLADGRSDRRADLHPAGAGADHADAFPGDIHRMVPACGVETGLAKIVQPGDGRVLWLIELARRADQNFGRKPGVAAVGLDRLDAPDRGRIVPHRAGHFLVEADFLLQRVHVRIAADVGQYLVAFGKKVVPVIVVAERIGIKMVGCVHTDAGIGVFKPGAADIGIFLDDGEWKPGLLQLDAHGHAGKARANDGNMAIGQCFG